MKIGDSISSYYPTNLFGRQSQPKNGTAIEIDAGVRQNGAALEPSTTPPSISKAMWAMQAAGDTTLGEDDVNDALNAALIAEFSEWAEMTPAEKIRAQYLEDHGLSEDSLEALPEDQRKAIEDEIAEQIKRQLAGVEDEGQPSETELNV